MLKKSTGPKLLEIETEDERESIDESMVNDGSVLLKQGDTTNDPATLLLEWRKYCPF